MTGTLAAECLNTTSGDGHLMGLGFSGWSNPPLKPRLLSIMTKYKYSQVLGSKAARTHTFNRVATALGTSVASVTAVSESANITSESLAGNVWSGTVEPRCKGANIVKLTATMADGQIVVDTFLTQVSTPTYAQIAGNNLGFDIQYG